MSAPVIESIKDKEGEFALLNLQQDTSITIACGEFLISIARADVGISVDVYGINTDQEPVASLTAWDEDVAAHRESIQ